VKDGFMTQSDYIMRMVEQLTQVLKQIISRRENGQFDSAYEILNETYESLVGFNSHFTHQLSDNQLISLLGGGTQSGNERLIVLSDLLSEEANLTEQSDDTENDVDALRVKALSLYLEVMNQSEYWQSDEYVLKIKEIRQMVDLKVIPIQVLEKMIVFYNTLSADEDLHSVRSELLHRNAM
jgi:hypothetical protein